MNVYTVAVSAEPITTSMGMRVIPSLRSTLSRARRFDYSGGNVTTLRMIRK